MSKARKIEIAVCACAIIILIVCAVIVAAKNMSQNKYSFIVEATYSGSVIEGKAVESQTTTKTYTIKSGDKFYEPFLGGDWEKNEKSNKDDVQPLEERLILEILDVTEENITINSERGEETLTAGSKIVIPSIYVVADGINYTYTVSLEAKK